MAGFFINLPAQPEGQRGLDALKRPMKIDAVYELVNQKQCEYPQRQQRNLRERGAIFGGIQVVSDPYGIFEKNKQTIFNTCKYIEEE